MRPMKKLIIFTLSILTLFNLISANCKDYNFYCPDGGAHGPQFFTDGGCWNMGGMRCDTCTNVIDLIKTCCNCRTYKCSGDVNKWFARIDGCSGPIQGYFEPACAIHDLCYSTPGIPKDSCDLGFRANMNSICSQNGDPSCYPMSEAAYIAVQKYGHPDENFRATCELN